jgi:myo-inositol catabolism protein IolC
LAIRIVFSRIQYQNPNSEGGAKMERNISLPELILWTGTRVALGTGIGMLISKRLSKDAMKAAGLALTLVGGLTTIPLAILILGKKNLNRPEIRSVA